MVLVPANSSVKDRRAFTLVWGVVALTTLLRLAAVAALPLTGDEAYYWEWSRHLAAGYVDHPPAVAFLIAAFSWIGRTPLAVRLPFVLCGLLATIFAAAAATRLAHGDRRAGRVTALALTLTPISIVLFGIATPDGPFALGWALSLYCAVRVFAERERRWIVPLGAAVGVTLLSRMLGLALAAGILVCAILPRQRDIWRRGFAIAPLVALALWAPFLLWNAQHDWVTFAFTFAQRHTAEVQFARPLLLNALFALAYSPGLFAAAWVVALRTRSPLVQWTALPLAAFLLVLAVRERVEVYWLLGPYISLCLGMGLAYATMAAKRRTRALLWSGVPALAMLVLLYSAALAPGAVYAGVRHVVRLSDDGPFEMFSYPPLARDVRRLTSAPGTIAMTDGYGFSSLLDFYAGVAPVVIGYDAQGAEARRWYADAANPKRALFVDKVPLRSRPDFEAQLARACRSVVAGPLLSYTYADAYGVDVPPRRYYTTWCDGVRANGISTLRWGR